MDNLIEMAEAALSQDPKIEHLIKEIQKIRSQEPGANILVYTEYVDSQKAAAQALKAAKLDEVLTMSGNDIESVRAEITDRFRTQNGIILVSTDASAEGLNLHDRCHHLIHLELPFNPNRLEQRNGRIDRYGQQFDPTVRYLYLQGTFEERILMRLIAKYERQRKRLTFVPNTLGLVSSSDTAQERLLKGIMDDDTKLFREQPTFLEFSESADEDDGQDEATRELLEEVDRSLKSFEQAARTNLWLGWPGPYRTASTGHLRQRRDAPGYLPERF
jgi:superfamily II DNA/RNA helicase